MKSFLTLALCLALASPAVADCGPVRGGLKRVGSVALKIVRLPFKAVKALRGGC